MDNLNLYYPFGTRRSALQEFIKHKGCDLSREELITRVWEEFGFTPSGNNLNKAVSELRKCFQSLDEGHEFIVTVPRYGFRFVADVVIQPRGCSIRRSSAILRTAKGKTTACVIEKMVDCGFSDSCCVGGKFYFGRQQGIAVTENLCRLTENCTLQHLDYQRSWTPVSVIEISGAAEDE